MDKENTLVCEHVEKIDSLYSKLSEFIKELNDILYSIPEEYRDSAFIEENISYEYGDKYSSLVVSYMRPETPREKELKLNKQKQIQEHRRQLYLKLKKEFENG